ncbi:hypothetical protein ASD80_02050 [Devosia sp. Root635]|nr:hypothetical protein ASD80_02050 [Devosia sp. Root635]
MVQLDRATRLVAGAAGLLLLLLVTLVSVAVIARYVFARPIVGVNEIIQMVSIAVVMLALPWCTSQGAHVRADVFDEAIGRYGRFIGDVVSRLLSASVLAVLCQRAWLKLLDTLEYGDKTNMLGLPVWPLYGLLALGVALCIPILLAQAAALAVDFRKTSK